MNSQRHQKICLLLLACMCGCGGTRESGLINEPIFFPETVQLDGTEWKRQPGLTAQDEQQLTDYFNKNPSMAEGPVVQGKPQVYISGEKRAYVWGRAVGTSGEWLFLELQGTSGTVHEGTGEPFL